MVQTVEVELYPGHWVCWGVIGLFVALAKGPRLEMLFSCACTPAQRILLRRRLWCQILEPVPVGANGGRRPRDCGDEPGGRLIGIRSGQVEFYPCPGMPRLKVHNGSLVWCFVQPESTASGGKVSFNLPMSVSRVRHSGEAASN